MKAAVGQSWINRKSGQVSNITAMKEDGLRIEMASRHTGRRRWIGIETLYRSYRYYEEKK